MDTAPQIVLAEQALNIGRALPALSHALLFRHLAPP